MRAALVALLILLWPASGAHAALGDGDPTFGVDGIVTVDLGGDERGEDVAVDLGDSAYVLGASYSDDADDVFTLTRFDSAGVADPGFDGDGTITIATQGSSGLDYWPEVDIDPQGRVLVAGSVRRPGAAFNLVVRRFLPDGSPDPEFGEAANGTVELDIDRNDLIARHGLDIGGGARNQRITIGLNTGNCGRSYQATVVRLNGDGTMDERFGRGGIAEIPGTNSVCGHEMAAITAPGGRAGIGAFVLTEGRDGDPCRSMVTELLGSGSVRRSFGHDGRKFVSFARVGSATYSCTKPSAIALLQAGGGRIRVAGIAHGGYEHARPGCDSRSTDIAVAGLNDNGGFDRHFSHDGRATYGTVCHDAVFDIGAQGDRVVLGGRANGKGMAALIRSNGSLEAEFGNRDGFRVLDLPSSVSFGLDAEGGLRRRRVTMASQVRTGESGAPKDLVAVRLITLE